MTDNAIQNQFPLIRRVARALRYRTIDAMIGQTVLVTSLDDIVPVTQTFVRRSFPQSTFVGPETKYLVGALAKYGLLNLEYDASADLLPAESPTGVSLLRELGFFPQYDEVDDPQDDELDEAMRDVSLACLQELETSLKENRTWLKLFMREPGTNPAAGDVADRMRLLEDPSLIEFPINFQVVDACITNSNCVWFNKHFYL